MALTNLTARQTISRDILQQIFPNIADKQLDVILRSINLDLTPPLRVDASSSPNLTVTVGPSVIDNTESGRQKSISHINSLIPSFTSGTVVFPSADSGTITVTPGTNEILNCPINNYNKILLSLDSTGNIVVTQGTPNVVEASVAVPVPVINTLPFAYISVFNNAGTIQNITQNKIFQMVGGGGGSTVTNTTLTYTGIAGEDLNTNDAIYICNTASDVGRTVGQVYKLETANGNRSTYLGIVTVGVLSGATVTVQVAGEIAGWTGLVQGAPIYANAIVPGSYQTTPPDPSAGATIILGWGSTLTTRLIINSGMNSSTVNPPPTTRTAAYQLGGRNSGGTPLSAIQKMLFSSELVTTLGASLPLAQWQGGGMSSLTKGYIGGGLDGASLRTNIIQALTFSGESTSSVSSVVSSSRSGLAGSQSGNSGYIYCGSLAGPVEQNTIDKMDFPTEATSVLGTNNSYSTDKPGVVASPSASYVCGGQTIIGPVYLTNISKMPFSTEVSAPNSQTLSVGRQGIQGVQSGSKGYIAGGYNGSESNVIEAVDFSNDSVSTLAAVLTPAKYEYGSASSFTKGYFQGGISSAVVVSTNLTLDFMTETSGSAAFAMASGLVDPAGVSY